MPATTPHSAGLGTPIQVKTKTKQRSKARIDQELHQQVPADAARRVVERLRHEVQLAEPDQPQKTVPQVFSLQQHEDRKDEDHSCPS